MLHLDKPSFQSLFLNLITNRTRISLGTGFVVLRPNGAPLLITNWHVVAGRHPQTRQPFQKSGIVPDTLQVYHNARGSLGNWHLRTEPLYDKAGEPLWLEHPVHGSSVDVVGLPLQDLNDVECYPYAYEGAEGHDAATLPAPVKWGPSDFVNVIGFPFGWTGGGSMGIWVQGAIATEPELPHDEKPCFLIDSRTREGQSGSPVILYKRNGWVTLTNGQPYMIHNPLTIFLGVYAGRLTAESDLGTVWKASVVAEIAERGNRGTIP